MLWIVQENLFIENKRGALLETLSRLDIPYIQVNVSKNTITPDIPDDSVPMITNGSIMLSKIAQARNWSPGSLFNDNFSYEMWAPQYNSLLLNKDAVFSTLGTADFAADRLFVRPVLDTKTFNGKVLTRKEFLELQSASLKGDTRAPAPDTPIVLAQPKTIGQEHRHYIVDGRVVTSSRYKLSGQPNFKEGADDAVLDVVNHAVSVWQPARAFVLDTYIAGDEIGIVEIGGICHAGLYEANLMKLVDALDTMPLDTSLEWRGSAHKM